MEEERALLYKEFEKKRYKEQLKLCEELREKLKIAIFRRLEAKTSEDRDLIDSKDLSDLIGVLRGL